MTGDDALDRAAVAACHRLICGRPTSAQMPELRDPDVADEVHRRLAACGLEARHVRGQDRWVVTGLAELRSDVPDQALSEPQMAALAYLYVRLELAPAPSEEQRPRVTVSEFCDAFGKQRGWGPEYVRRAVLGPLAAAEYVRVVTPGQSKRAAYAEAGPRMGLLDRQRVLRRLERAARPADTADPLVA